MTNYSFAQRLAAGLLAFFMCFCVLPVPIAFADELPAEANEAVNEPVEEPVTEDISADFIAAVEALDRNAVIKTANDWGLAHDAWEKAQDDAELTKKLDEAIDAQAIAMEPVYAAEDMYYELTEEQQANEQVTAAFSSLSALIATAFATMENPVIPEEDTETPESKDQEVHPTEPETIPENMDERKPNTDDALNILYGDLPHAPTGSYMGRLGLPVAIGETKISISPWETDMFGSNNAGRLTAAPLEEDNLEMTVAKQKGRDYAIVPILTQVEYPAKDSTATIILPENVVLLSYLSMQNALKPATAEEANEVLNSSFSDVSASAQGMYLKATESFSVQLVYSGANGELTKTIHVMVEDGSASSVLRSHRSTSTYVDAPPPPFTTGVITKVVKGNSTWLIWFNGMEAYCCDNGKNGRPTDCPDYNYTHASMISADQKKGTHEETQIAIWGGLDQLALGGLTELRSEPFSDSEFAKSATVYSLKDQALAEFCYKYYTDEQLAIIEYYPDSWVAKSYLDSARAVLNGAELYQSDKGYYTYIFETNNPAWQRVAILGDTIQEPECYAEWAVEPQSASGSYDSRYELTIDKQQLDTAEKIDGAVFDIEPITKSGTIDGGSWAITPAEKKTVTTAGHTQDDSYHKNGGAASAEWSLHYSVSKTTPGGDSGKVGPYSTQEEADAAAASEANSARNYLKSQAQGMVNSAISNAKRNLATIDFTVNEMTVPFGFKEYTGEKGSAQTIAVAADTVNTAVVKNDEWELQITISKVDSETGKPIAADAEFAIFQWDTVEQAFMPFGGYNQYKVVRQPDGSYKVMNSSSYADNQAKKETLYYTQRNEGKFLIVETRAPAGYYGDWTDNTHPGTAGSIAGKRAYAFTISAENDGSIIQLDNNDYNADIVNSAAAGKRVKYQGDNFTVIFHTENKSAVKTYQTDPSGIAANENEFTMTPTDHVMKNDRTMGSIILTKNDLEALQPLAPGQHGEADIEGAVYDLYVAEDIHHPDGVSGIVDYSKVLKSDNAPVWHTTVKTNSGWNDFYLPTLNKDKLVASAAVHNGKLAFANLYLGKYYLVERATGIVLPINDNGLFYVTGTYPELNKKLEPTGSFSALATHEGKYTDYVYKNLFSSVAESRALDGRKTYDGYYLSFGKGYLCDEINHYQDVLYVDEASYILQHSINSDDAVMKSGFSLNKVISNTGESNGIKLEGAGFTVFQIRDLSKADQFTKTPDGRFSLQSVLDSYRKDHYDQDNPKYDFSNESQAIVTMYENDSDIVAAYNATLTEAGDYANGKGEGWKATDKANNYRLSELFSNEEGMIRVEGLPYGQYLVVETTVPKDVFQADPFLIIVDKNTPQSRFCIPAGSDSTPSNSYLSFNILDEEIEGYLQIEKVDAETGKTVKLANTAFKIYSLKNGKETLVEMNDPRSGDPTAKTSVFYTDENGLMKTPEKLPVGRYRIVEEEGPKGYFNNTQYNVEFDLTTDRVWEVIGGSADGMDDYIIRERYVNHETVGRITLRKVGEVLSGFAYDYNADILDPMFSNMAYPGQFLYEMKPIPNAEFTVIAQEDIYTQDNQFSNGERTKWFAAGDVVAVVNTGDGTSSSAVIQPTRTIPTNDFMSVIHDGTIGEVSLILPLGTYRIEETKAPYGYIGTAQSYEITLAWDNQSNQVVLASSVVGRNGDTETTSNYDVLEYDTATEEQKEDRTVIFKNEREKAEVLVHKKDAVNDIPLAGAIFNLYSKNDIYNADGELIFPADGIIATSQETEEDGKVKFSTDLPVCGEYFEQAGIHINTGSGFNHQTNSGSYYVKEVRSPVGYYLNDQPLDFTFSPNGDALQQFENVCGNNPTDITISKQDLTNSNELPGATLTIKDQENAVVKEWISGTEPTHIYGLKLNTIYHLVEKLPAPGYAFAESIKFKLVQAEDSEGLPLDSADIYVCTGKDALFFDHWELLEDSMLVMKDDITKLEISKRDITSDAELPGAHLRIIDSTGKVVESWVSTDEPHRIDRIPAGDYVLEETSAPSGFDIAESIRFTVLPNGEIQTVVMYDRPTPAPATPTDVTVPKTWDSSNPAGMILLLIGSSLALAALLLLRYHNRKRELERSDKKE